MIKFKKYIKRKLSFYKFRFGMLRNRVINLIHTPRVAKLLDNCHIKYLSYYFALTKDNPNTYIYVVYYSKVCRINPDKNTTIDSILNQFNMGKDHIHILYDHII